PAVACLLIALPAAAGADPAGPPAPGKDSVLPTDIKDRCEGGDCRTAPALPASTTDQVRAERTGRTSGGVVPGGSPAEGGGTVVPQNDGPASADGADGSGGTSPDGGDDRGSTDWLIEPTTVPNFMIEKFEIPPFLLPIYQACGSQYGIPWEILASINRIETGFGTFLTTSSAGAQGWMMFMPPTWEAYGLDANGDGKKDPYNPVDAICAAAGYLEASGYAEDEYDAIFAYNHADWYVQDVLEHARRYAAIPDELITALTGLTEGARFPVAGEARYEGQISTEDAGPTNTRTGAPVEAAEGRTSIEIEGEGGAPVIAVNDGVITEIDTARGVVELKDAYGNAYRYSGLGSIAQVHPVPRAGSGASADSTFVANEAPAPTGATEMGGAKSSAPTAAAAAQGITEIKVDPERAAVASRPEIEAADTRRSEQAELVQVREGADQASGPMNTENMRGRTYANPLRPQNQTRAAVDGTSVKTPGPTGGEGLPGDYLVYGGTNIGILRLDPSDTELLPLKEGSRVLAGTVLGRLAETPTASIDFAIRPAGEGAPAIDPKPFLDGWRLLAETDIYNARGKNRFSSKLGAGGVLLLSKNALQKRVLLDPRLDIPECDRGYIAAGVIDRRVLAVLAYLSAQGYELLISSMHCGREASITTSGYVSNHSRASAVDIAAINGEVISAATQGPGTLTDRVAREVLALQGTMAPDEVITLLDYPQPAGFAMGDHDDHIHVGYSSYGDPSGGPVYVSTGLGPEQWEKLVERLESISNPEIPDQESGGTLPTGTGTERER
ncbi:MAG: lytic murein transglycosylase, partial [Solirubrobacterales bacterium]